MCQPSEEHASSLTPLAQLALLFLELTCKGSCPMFQWSQVFPSHLRISASSQLWATFVGNPVELNWRKGNGAGRFLKWRFFASSVKHGLPRLVSSSNLCFQGLSKSCRDGLQPLKGQVGRILSEPCSSPPKTSWRLPTSRNRSPGIDRRLCLIYPHMAAFEAAVRGTVR